MIEGLHKGVCIVFCNSLITSKIHVCYLVDSLNKQLITFLIFSTSVKTLDLTSKSKESALGLKLHKFLPYYLVAVFTLWWCPTTGSSKKWWKTWSKCIASPWGSCIHNLKIVLNSIYRQQFRTDDHCNQSPKNPSAYVTTHMNILTYRFFLNQSQVFID